MTTIGVHLGWLAVRATLFSLAALALAWWAARRGPRSAVIVLAAAMLVLLAMSLGALAPSVDVHLPSPFAATAPPGAAAAGDAGADLDADGPRLPLAQLWSLLLLHSHDVPPSDGFRRGAAIVAYLYVAGVILAVGRFGLGWLAIGSLRRRSEPIIDPGLLGLAESVRRVLGCGAIELRECDEPGLAATIGWRRPLIFLPPEWRTWSAVEMHAVLAHEFAHVRHGDALSSLLTRLCQALHFYHPLVHVLTRQVRWQQERAADDLAVSALADRGAYVKSLASLALRSPARTPAGAWPMSAMWGGTFLRRMEMLRENRTTRPMSTMTRGLAIAALAALGLLLTTLGGAATPLDERPAEKTEPFEIGYLPSTARGFVALRPAYWVRQPNGDRISQLFAAQAQILKDVGFPWPNALLPENIEEIVVNAELTSKGTGEPGSRSVTFATSSVYMRMNVDFDWPAFFQTVLRFVHGNKKEAVNVAKSDIDGITIYSLGVVPNLGPAPVHFCLLDRRTILFSATGKVGGAPGDDVKAFRQLIRNAPQTRMRDWGSYDKVARAPIALAFDNHDGQYFKRFDNDLPGSLLEGLRSARFATLGVEMGEGRPIRVLIDAKSVDAAPAVEKALRGTIDHAAQAFKEHQSEFEGPMGEALRKLAGELIASSKVERDGARVEWRGYSSIRLPDVWNLENVPQAPDDAKPDGTR
jgi:beta-lactamase regulating signal transducer with metallopeptidase domain